MKKIVLITSLCFHFLNSYSQGVSNLWLMGGYSWAGPPWGGIKMDFTGGNLNMALQNWKMNFNSTNGEICNENGDLLFTSNGIWVSNANNDTMVNGGRGFNPGYFTTSKDSQGLTIPQANLIIPFPGDSTKYYLFHETCDDYGNTYCTLFLYYSVIDMELDGGNGAVVQKNVILLSDSLVAGKLTACKHANGRDWWLIAHEYLTNSYHKYLISPTGISGPFDQNLGSIVNVLGQCVFSPDGKYFAYFDPLPSNIATQGNLNVFDFDRCTGNLALKAEITINNPSQGGGGVAFSANSQVLYLSCVDHVYQFDMSAGNIPLSQTTVAVYDGFISTFPTTFYLLQLAPDGKIYNNCGNSTQDIHVINYPNNIGLSCDVCQHCIHLPATNFFTIANHPNYFLGAESGSPCDTITGFEDMDLTQSTTLKIFPNPVTSQSEITFTYPSMSDKSFIIINSTEGKEVLRYEVPQWSSIQHLKLPKLSSGIYVARFIGENTLANVKFIVSNY